MMHVLCRGQEWALFRDFYQKPGATLPATNLVVRFHMAGNVAEACQVIDLILSDAFRVFSAELRGNITELAFVKVSSQAQSAHWSQCGVIIACPCGSCPGLHRGCMPNPQMLFPSCPNAHFPITISLLTILFLIASTALALHDTDWHTQYRERWVLCSCAATFALTACDIPIAGEPRWTGLYTAWAQRGTGQQPGAAANGLPQPSQEGHHHQLRKRWLTASPD